MIFVAFRQELLTTQLNCGQYLRSDHQIGEVHHLYVSYLRLDCGSRLEPDRVSELKA